MVESLNHIQEELILRLYKPLIFYIPRKLFKEIEGFDWSNKKFDEVFDKLVLIKSDGSNQELGSNPSYFYILMKTAELEKNIYSLLEVKERYGKESFNFLISKYNQHVDFYIRITNWLLENVKEDISEVTQETLNSLTFQKDAFLAHRVYIQTKLIKVNQEKSSADNDKLTKGDLMSIKALLEGNSSQFKESNDNPNVKSNRQDEEKPQTVKNKKKLLITDKQAEDFLLQTVFKMKL
jgi:hypothetical protein